ncbi:MAG TPA: TonB family protein, partial [Pyrinomonadaceae bacterium]|nr:TonB family protein [Pyrinomonadaceae bacterium]
APQANVATQPAANNAAPAQPLSVVKTAAAAPSPAPSPAKHNDNAAAPLLPKAALSASANVTLSAPANVASAGAGNVAAVVKVDDAPPPPNVAPKAPVKPMSGGVLNGRAVNLPVPEYPLAARNAHASGLVTVEVVVDVNGRVISAHATSGHASLRAAAEQAALRARFSPTLLSGQPVKVVGVIHYNFAL